MRASVLAGGSEVINVIPDSAELKMDIRIAPHVPPEDMVSLLDGWCREVNSQTPGVPVATGGGVSWKQINNTPKQHYVTSCDPATNPWYNIIMTCIQSQCGIKLNPSVFPAATDSRFLRALGVKAFGFSPMRRSPILLHENDEYLTMDVFVEGCEIYARLLRALTLSDEFEPYIDPSTIQFKSGGCTWDGNDTDDDGAAEGCPLGYSAADADVEEVNELQGNQGSLAAPAATVDKEIDEDKITEALESTGLPQVPAKLAKCPYGYA